MALHLIERDLEHGLVPLILILDEAADFAVDSIDLILDFRILRGILVVHAENRGKSITLLFQSVNLLEGQLIQHLVLIDRCRQPKGVILGNPVLKYGLRRCEGINLFLDFLNRNLEDRIVVFLLLLDQLRNRVVDFLEFRSSFVVLVAAIVVVSKYLFQLFLLFQKMVDFVGVQFNHLLVSLFVRFQADDILLADKVLEVLLDIPKD